MKTSKILIVLFTLGFSLGAFANNQCSPSFTSCEFYSCKEKARPCGKDGYWEKFAVPYCNVFLKKEKQYSQPLRAFLPKVRQCLQASINDYTHSASCGDIKKLAFNSHVNCYVNSGFCHLSKLDQLTIANEVRGSFLNLETWQEAAAVNKACQQLNELGRYW